jgi:hypothetical protein
LPPLVIICASALQTRHFEGALGPEKFLFDFLARSRKGKRDSSPDELGFGMTGPRSVGSKWVYTHSRRIAKSEIPVEEAT